MKYEFRGNSISAALSNALTTTHNVRGKSTTLDAGIGGSFTSATISKDVELGRTYRISWEAQDPANDGAAYAIAISSFDGHGSHSETFTHGGEWDFVAQTTGTIEFAIEISFSAGNRFFD